jgi:protein-disulfide isomerase
VIGCLKIDLSTTALRKALDQRTFEARVRDDFKGGVRSGVNGTPTFFINGQRHDSSFDYETFASAIQQAMSTTRSA